VDLSTLLAADVFRELLKLNEAQQCFSTNGTFPNVNPMGGVSINGTFPNFPSYFNPYLLNSLSLSIHFIFPFHRLVLSAKANSSQLSTILSDCTNGNNS